MKSINEEAEERISAGIPPKGFTHTKGDRNYFLDSVKDLWAETGISTDSMEMLLTIHWYDIWRERNEAAK